MIMFSVTVVMSTILDVTNMTTAAGEISVEVKPVGEISLRSENKHSSIISISNMMTLTCIPLRIIVAVGITVMVSKRVLAFE